MRSLFILAASFAFLGCSDNATEQSTVIDSSANKQETEKVTTHEHETTSPGSKAEEPAKKDNVEVKEQKEDTPRTSISIGKSGAEVKTKRGTGVSVDDKGVKVNNKDVKIDIKKDSL